MKPIIAVILLMVLVTTAFAVQFGDNTITQVEEFKFKDGKIQVTWVRFDRFFHSSYINGRRWRETFEAVDGKIQLTSTKELDTMQP